ncbi:MAG: cbb3-type cytochrome c oxidase subunit I [Hyphomonadaceae bacterium]|nr:cbb3-type cytochrome c oxidase subunit I [Hyphomonadaceae bacterium]
MWRTNKLPIAFFIAALAILVWAGWTGHQLSRSTVDTAMHDTYFVVVNLRYHASLMGLFVGFGVIYVLFHRLVGVAYRRWFGVVQFLLLASGIGLVLWAGAMFAGAPLRYTEYSEALQRAQWIGRVGYIVTLISVCVFAICLAEAISRRIRHGKEPLRTDDRLADHF